MAWAALLAAAFRKDNTIPIMDYLYEQMDQGIPNTIRYSYAYLCCN